MRSVDINGSAAQAAPDVDETWFVNPEACRHDPAMVGSVAAAGANMRECVVAMPGSAGDLDGRVKASRAAGAPAVVRVCPGTAGHGYPMEPWAIGPIPEYCEREDLVIVAGFGEDVAFPWSEVVAFARSYPRLAFVALGAPIAGPTAARALNAAPNLVLDTSGIAAAELPALAVLARSHGAYRLAYGSGKGAVNVRQIVDALDAADAAMVLCGTAERLDKGTWGSEYL